MDGRPVLAAEGVRGWAEVFGLCGGDAGELAEVRDLPSYDDLNFHLRAAGGGEYVLKAHNGRVEAGTPQRLLAQDRFIARLNERGLPVPSVVVAPGRSQAAVPMRDGGCGHPANQDANIRVLSWLPGRILPNGAPKGAELLGAVGRICGQVSTALSGFEDEGAHWDWDWNMKNVAAACEARLDYVRGEERGALARRFVARYREALAPEVMASLPHSVIHGDLNDTNLLFDDAGEKVVGILDFGDSIHSCTVFDVGITAGYFALGQPDPLWVFQRVLAGYLQDARLDEAEARAFYHVAYGRVLLSAVFSAESCAREPGNEYLAHTSEVGWAVLTALDAVDPSTAEDGMLQIWRATGFPATGK